ncbi:MAG: FeoC-like transcriptional regulator [Burkholderiales bacterium]|nr:FeoC-like transcriptional regulator [Burkholderiales bacterium]
MKLRDYLKEKHAVSLTDVSRHFDIPESATQSMLEHWVRKGCVALDVGVSCGGGCGGCASARRCDGNSMIYWWRSVQ